LLAVTFPTWHRPYVALYEQLLAAQFPTIIQMYSAANPSLASQLSNSAQVWRLPYWDWGLDSSIPDEWSATTINVWATDGGVTAVANPLNNYAFHPIDGSFSDEFIVWPKTLRQPTHNGWDAKSHPEIANQELAAAQLDRLILDMFPLDKFFVDPWGSFSNHEWKVTSPIEGYRTSLENVHDKVHEAIGGWGHMGSTSMAGFDPIFFLHHAQVDRLFSLWQAVNPNLYVSPGPDYVGYIPLCDLC
jgi:tyrosinase